VNRGNFPKFTYPDENAFSTPNRETEAETPPEAAPTTPENESMADLFNGIEARTSPRVILLDQSIFAATRG
jgi:hypothetical protein